MHPSALDYGKRFFETYAEPHFERVLDVGAFDVNGSLRSVCPKGLAYTGVDLVAGKGVDLVLDDPYTYPFPDNHFHMIVSTSCFEHDSLFWLTFIEAIRVLAPGGMFYINAPSNGIYHAHPIDCWRFYPDAGLALQEWAKRSGLEVELLESFTGERSGGDDWNDFVMIFQKSGLTDLKHVPISSRATSIKNVRCAGKAEMDRASRLPEDLRIIVSLRNENAELRRKIETLQSGR